MTLGADVLGELPPLLGIADLRDGTARDQGEKPKKNEACRPHADLPRLTDR